MASVPARPFRFGVNMRTASSGRGGAEGAGRVEALGSSTLTVPDHFSDTPSPMPAIVAAAAATTRLRVGTLVLNNDFRHPVLLAREAALIDVLTDGRLQLGLGAGYMKSEYDQAGLPFDRGGVRVARLGESVTIVESLVRGDTVAAADAGRRSRQPVRVAGLGRRDRGIAATAA